MLKFRPKVTEVGIQAKKYYCEIRKPGWLGLIYKVQAHETLTDLEYQNYQQLEREILNAVNQRATLIDGLTRNRSDSARFSYMGCIFMVKYSGGVGKIVAIQRET
jgi:hypothetical protein